MHLPEDQMQHFYDYFDSGKPLIALRTANHGFWGGLRYKKSGKNISLREMLGGTFMGHHGGWHREATRGVVVSDNKKHPILIGVEDIWGTSDVYRCHNDKNPFPKDCTSLVLGQPLINLKKDAPPNTKKEPLPVAWTKTWIGNKGLESKVFHFTMGSAVDFENEGVRRMTVNAVYWGLGMEKEIKPDSSVAIIGDYEPLKAGFNYEKLGVKLIGLSVDQVFSHMKWTEWIKEKLGVEIQFPIIAANDSVANKIGLLHPGKGTNTVRAVFVGDPEGKVRLVLYYPQEIGRNIDEVVRAVKALQISDANGVAVPAGWPDNELVKDRVIIPPPDNEKDAAERLEKYDGYDWWFCHKEL
jgi:peroxiredoxin (alkyl hydroperoxide reductase subunit C)